MSECRPLSAAHNRKLPNSAAARRQRARCTAVRWAQHQRLQLMNMMTGSDHTGNDWCCSDTIDQFVNDTDGCWYDTAWQHLANAIPDVASTERGDAPIGLSVQHNMLDGEHGEHCDRGDLLLHYTVANCTLHRVLGVAKETDDATSTTNSASQGTNMDQISTVRARPSLAKFVKEQEVDVPMPWTMTEIRQFSEHLEYDTTYVVQGLETVDLRADADALPRSSCDCGVLMIADVELSEHKEDDDSLAMAMQLIDNVAGTSPFEE